MIEKMEFLSITGPKEDIDRVVGTYLTRYPMHLENALTELSLARDIYPFIEANPYRDTLNKAREYAAMIADADSVEPVPMKVDAAVEMINQLDEQVDDLRREQEQMENLHREKEEMARQLAPFRALPVDVSELLHFQFVKYRFGRIPTAGYARFKSYVYDNMDVIFYKCLAEKDYVWGIYFVPEPQADHVDAIMSTLHFEHTDIQDVYHGNGTEAYTNLQKECMELAHRIAEKRNAISELVASKAAKLLGALKALEDLTFNFDVRKVAAVTREMEHTFYILCGWMAEDDAEAFRGEIENDEKVFVIVVDADKELISSPPTKLKNPKLVKPFEMFTRMYGLPSYGEIDPTIFVAITYSFIFGAMFGDLGQGLCLLIGGLALYKFRKMDLAGIIACAGVFSSFFGIMFGSFFGFEDVFEAIWLRPKEAMMQVPFIGNLNTVFVVAIAFGMFLVLVTMIFRMINAYRRHRMGELLFDTNGLAGFAFYGFVVLVVVLFMTGHRVPAGVILALMFGIPLLCLALKEPLTRAMEKEQPLVEGGIGMYIVQTFFELFEVMLSFFSNTLSFVRVGAFAVSHAAMMEVVLMLAGAENGGSPNWVVVVLGNLFVCGLEGLIVGIQVLRLEYYEMFSRYYEGSGREFKAFGRKRA